MLLRARLLGTAAGAFALLLHGCQSADAAGEACAASAATRAQALFMGSTDGGALGVSPPDRPPIGAIVLADDDSVLLCTATVIAPGIGLTAAHCGQLGAIAFRLRDTTPVPISDSTPHPTLDVMVFRFDDDGIDGVTPIALVDGAIGSDWEGREVTLAGVGQTEAGDSGELRFVREPVVAVTPTELHVDGMGERGACGGDSGGPLLVQDLDGAARIAGILDRGAPDCRGLDIYIRVDAFIEWLSRSAATSSEGACARRAAADSRSDGR